MFDKILCLSGGLDSIIAWYFLGKPKTIFFNTGSYSTAEEEIVKKLVPDTIIDHSLSFANIDTDKNAFIPNRNLLFAARAAAYAKTVYIAGVKDDQVGDKNETAFYAMSNVLCTINPGEEFAIKSPFWGRTKAEIVHWFLINIEGAKKIIDISLSCYTPINGKECLSCPSCFRKWNALWENGIQYKFLDVGLMKEYLEKACARQYNQERNISIIKCVRAYLGGTARAGQKKEEGLTYCFDIDGVLTNETEGYDYESRTPKKDMIIKLRELYKAGHRIILQTARYHEDLLVTQKWLAERSVPYHELRLGKPKADFYIDDRMIRMEEV